MIYTFVWDGFPSTKARSFLTETEDGDYIIIINARMSHHQQVRGYLHELRHIRRRDFEKGDVSEAEG